MLLDAWSSWQKCMFVIKQKVFFYNVKQDAQQCCWMIGLVGKGKGVGVVFLARESSSHVTLVPITNNSTALHFQFLDSDVLFNIAHYKQ